VYSIYVAECVCVFVCVCVCVCGCVCACVWVCGVCGVCVVFFIFLLSMLHYKGVILHASLCFCCRGCSEERDLCIHFTFDFTFYWVTIASIIDLGYQMRLNLRIS